MNDTSLNDPGYSVYLLYQKEVYNCDHAFLQSMMDWLYSSNDSPYKFIVRNKAFISINHYGILIQKEYSNGFDSSVSEQSSSSNWASIHFNFKHLKEIYVDKRHKDTCVLVSKVSASSSSNYVWKKTNPSNYQSFRSPYGLNNAYKKSFLLTILKFKDGPSRLLQTIQLLDSVLVDFNKKEDHNSTTTTTTTPSSNNNTSSSNNNSKNNNETTKSNNSNNNNNETNTKFNNVSSTVVRASSDINNFLYNSLNKGSKEARSRPNVQQYYNDYYMQQQQQQLQQQQHQQHQQHVNGGSNLNIHQPFSNHFDLSGHNSLRTKTSQQYKGPRNLSIDNKIISASSTLYQNYNNNSNVSLQNFPLAPNTNHYFYNGNFRQSQSSHQQQQQQQQQPQPQQLAYNSNSNLTNISRQSSINDLRTPNNPGMLVNRANFLPNSNNNISIYNSYLDINLPNSVSASPLPGNQSSLYNAMMMKNFPSPFFNSVNALTNPSNDNLSEIGYQQYKKKFSSNRNLNVLSTSSLTNSENHLNNLNNNQNANNNSNVFNDSSATSTPATIMNANDKANNSHLHQPFHHHYHHHIPSNYGRYNGSINNLNNISTAIFNNGYSTLNLHYTSISKNDLNALKYPENHNDNKNTNAINKNTSENNNTNNNSNNTNSNNQTNNKSEEDTKNDNVIYIDQEYDEENILNTGSDENDDDIDEMIQDNENDINENNDDNNQDNNNDHDHDDHDNDENNHDEEDEEEEREIIEEVNYNYEDDMNKSSNINLDFNQSFYPFNNNDTQVNEASGENGNVNGAINDNDTKTNETNNEINNNQEETDLNIQKEIDNIETNQNTDNFTINENNNNNNTTINDLPKIDTFEETFNEDIIKKNSTDTSSDSPESNLVKAKSKLETIKKIPSSVLRDLLKSEVSSYHMPSNKEQQSSLHHTLPDKTKLANLVKHATISVSTGLNIVQSSAFASKINSSKSSISNITSSYSTKSNFIDNQNDNPLLISKKSSTFTLNDLKSNSPTDITNNNRSINNLNNEIKESNIKVRDIINSFNNYNEKNSSNISSALNSSLNATTTTTLSTVSKPMISKYDSLTSNSLSRKIDSAQFKTILYGNNNTNSTSILNSSTTNPSPKTTNVTINVSNLQKLPPPVKTVSYLSSNQNLNSAIDALTSKPMKSVNFSSSVPKLNTETASLTLQLNSNNDNTINSQYSNKYISKNLQKNILIDTKQQPSTVINTNQINLSPSPQKQMTQQPQQLPQQQISYYKQSANVQPLKNELNISKHTNNSLNSKTNGLVNDSKANTSLISNDINIINNKLARIVNLLSSGIGDTSQLKSSSKFEYADESSFIDTSINKSEKNSSFSANTSLNSLSGNSSIYQQVSPKSSKPPNGSIVQRKRTFANMVWPMDPEEERILRSTSPFIVPEIIVQRNERVKSILKKNNCFLNQAFNLDSPNNQQTTTTTTTTSITSSASSKKRVDFHENCCLINFFDINDEELSIKT